MCGLSLNANDAFLSFGASGLMAMFAVLAMCAASDPVMGEGLMQSVHPPPVSFAANAVISAT